MQLNWLDEKASVLSAGFPEKMVLLDCETTGGSSTRHRIIEIGLLLVDDGEVSQKWQTFIDPGSGIPPAIQSLTGIRPGMLEGAPRFADISAELMDKLDERTLVAHNARFDYGFLKNEFRRAGVQYQAKPLCSVKFSRLMFPQFRRHGLDQIIRRFQFPIENRHRALDDAGMIHAFFLKSSELFSEDEIQAACIDLLKRPALPALLDAAQIDKLPSSAGVYYFYDQAGALLYVGKSVHVRNRVMSHFSQDYNNPKDLQMSARIAHIDFDRTPSDLGAQLLESMQIKSMLPLYNRRLRKVRKLFQYRLRVDELGYQHVAIGHVESEAGADEDQFGLFRSQRQACQRLERLADQYFLCHKLLGLESDTTAQRNKPCFRAQLKKCLGACHGAEKPEAYNERIAAAFRNYQVRMWPWPGAILIEERNPEDADCVAYHLVDQWRYIARLSIPEDIFEHGYRACGEAETSETAQSTRPSTVPAKTGFDLDIYFILVRFLLDPARMRLNSICIQPLALLEPESCE